MKRIKTTAIVTVASGEINLTAAQAKTRMACLAPVKLDRAGNGLFAITSAIQFKAGEEFGYDGELSKTGIYFDAAAEAEQKLNDIEAAREAGRAEGRAEADKYFAAERKSLDEQIERTIAEARAAGVAEGLAQAQAAAGQ